MHRIVNVTRRPAEQRSFLAARPSLRSWTVLTVGTAGRQPVICSDMFGLRLGTSTALQGSARRFSIAAVDPATHRSALHAVSAVSQSAVKHLWLLPKAAVSSQLAPALQNVSPQHPSPDSSPDLPGPPSNAPSAPALPTPPALLWSAAGGSLPSLNTAMSASYNFLNSFVAPFKANNNNMETGSSGRDANSPHTRSSSRSSQCEPNTRDSPHTDTHSNLAPEMSSQDGLQERRHSSSASSTSGRPVSSLHHHHQPHHRKQRHAPSQHASSRNRTPQPHHNHGHHQQQQQRHRQPHPPTPQQPQHRPHPQPHHPTLRLIASRLRSRSQPGSRSDGARLGLVVEGGGMRGCISGAMLMGLHDLGLTHVFDAVYGASAGAINATYFLSGQRHGLRIYHEDLTRGSAFLDFRNLFSGSSRPVMNIDFLIEEVMAASKPLDWDAVLASPAPLKVVASCLDSLQPAVLSDFSDRQELAAALKATAAVPHFAGPPRVLRGRNLVDAAVFEPVPVPSAIRDGCTHLLVLCTRPPPVRSAWAKRMQHTIEALAKTTVLNAPYMREAWRTASSPAYASQDEDLAAALSACPYEYRRTAGAYVLPLYPEHTAGCHPLCLDPATLLAACEVGRSALLRLLGPV
ncbi:hypothetical protein Agub_g9340, partial [Astrephomene gubernaculifera]